MESKPVKLAEPDSRTVAAGGSRLGQMRRRWSKGTHFSDSKFWGSDVQYEDYSKEPYTARLKFAKKKKKILSAITHTKRVTMRGDECIRPQQ